MEETSAIDFIGALVDYHGNNVHKRVFKDVRKVYDNVLNGANTKSLCKNCVCDCALEEFSQNDDFVVSKCARHRI